MTPGPAPTQRTRDPHSAADAALISTLVAMRRSPGRFCPVFLKLVEAELRGRRWGKGAWEEPLAEPLEIAQAATQSHQAETLPEDPSVGSDPVLPAVTAATRDESPTRENPFGQTKQEKHQDEVEAEMSRKQAQPTGSQRRTQAPAKNPQSTAALRRVARRPMTGEERGSLAAWSTLLALAVVAFFTWTPSRPGRRGSEILVRVTLPAADDPALLSTVAMARLPLPAILEAANSSDAQARGRMIVALVRRGAAPELAGLLVHPNPGVRGAIPQALASLGLVAPEQVGDYTARLLSPVSQRPRSGCGRVVEPCGAWTGRDRSRAVGRL